MLHRHQHELKQEGAIEAAQDPKSSVSSEDAQRVLVQETRKAGGAALTFDPNATPEQKAAQARANIPDNFHHERSSHAVGVVSDADLKNSKPDYDLPEATTAGAVSRPSTAASTTAGTKTAPEEDARWSKDRTGWAPRFGGGDPADDEGPTLADHQTWLESRVSDAFYGDWYHNTGIIIFACLTTYITTLLGAGLSGMFIILAFCATYYRTSVRRVRRNFRDDVRREMAKARLETDTESLEWINSFLVKFWPIFAPVLCDTIINSVDQVLSTSTPAFLDSLRMKTFVLGTKPPRMEHVKTYPKTEEDTVLMDWKFSFNPNDTADLTARQLKNKINPKVVLEIRIGKGVVSKGLDVIVEDFAFSGTMRVKFKLQIPFPHVEKAEISFLGKPEIDYVCKPLGGETFGFDINFIPGLESFIQEQIHANLGPMMYDPNVFPIEIAKMLSGDAVDQAIGIVQVVLHGGQGLKNPDKYPGIPDPYITFSINNRDVVGKTKTIKQNSTPRFNETFNIIVTSLKDTLTLQAFDWNEYRKDKELGVASFPLDRLEEQEIHENCHLEVMRGGRASGILEADIRFFPVLQGTPGPSGVEEVPESNTGIAKFIVEQAKELDGSKSLIGQLNPYAVLLLNGKEVHISQKLKRTNNPIWPNAFKELLITDRKTTKLGLVIKDDRDIATDPIIGTYQIKLDDMLELSKRGQEWYNLAGVKTGRAKMMLQWKPVALTGAMGGSGGYVTPVGVMRLHFKAAKNLLNLEGFGGKSDPYVRVLLSGVEKGRTVTFQNNLNPDWDEIIYVPVHQPRERLTLEVMDSEKFQSDRSLGAIELHMTDFIKKNDDGEYEIIDDKKIREEPLKLHNRKEARGTLIYTASFFPTLNVVDPSEEEEANGKESIDASAAGSARPSMEKNGSARHSRSGTISSLRTSVDISKKLAEGEKEQGELEELKEKEPPKIKISADDLSQYESGLLVFKLLDADLAHHNVHVEVIIDDYLYPSYISSKATNKQSTFNETGDAMIRELEMSKITLRLRQKLDKKGDGGSEEHVLAKLSGNTLDVLKRALYTPATLALKDEHGHPSSVSVQLRYLPVKMQLDPSESINNMGTLRVDVHDAAELPAADRNGFSDPYCKFILNGKQVYKTETQKKTLHPSWNETFETKISSRTAAKFKIECWDWDRGDSDDLLGTAEINLDMLEPFVKQEVHLGLDGKSGTVRLNMLFKPDYVTRARQGSTTFQGTFAVPGKVIGAPVKGVGKGAMFVGGNVVRGASFVSRGFRRRKTGSNEDVYESVEGDATPDVPATPASTSTTNVSHPPTAAAKAMEANGTANGSPTQRVTSAGRDSIASTAAPQSVFGEGSPGSATFTIVSATGYEGSNIRVSVKQVTPKGNKDIHKSKELKSHGEEIKFDEHHETFKVSCTADTQFVVQVKDVKTFGSDKELGDGMLVVVDSPGGGTKQVHAGSGTVTFKSSFASAETVTTPDKRRKLFGGIGKARSVTPSTPDS